MDKKIKEYEMTYHFRRTVEGEVTFIVEEEELFDFGINNILDMDCFNDAVREETNVFPSYGEIEILSVDTKKLD